MEQRPAFEEHAHNGLATALWDGVFLYRLETRLRGLCASMNFNE